jgi:hypothetical protein
MSWAKVFKINSDLKKPLNTLISELISALSTKVTSVDTKVGNVSTQVSNVSTQVGNVNTAVGNVNTKLTQISTQMQNSKCIPYRVITTSGTYTPEKTGTYMVICVGAGGDGGSESASNVKGGGGGGGGGVAIKTLRLLKTGSYAVTVSTTASFTYDSNTIITATSGGRGNYDRESSGGTASGGDYNFNGTGGDNTYSAAQAPMPGSVTATIVGLTRTPQPYIGTLGSSRVISFTFGESILDYGGGGTGAGYYDSSSDKGEYATAGKKAAIVIIPLELEE